MQMGWNLLAGAAALGIGFAAGSLRPIRPALDRAANPTDAPAAITFLGQGRPKPSETHGDLLDPLPFSTYTEAKERLASLVEASARLSGIHFAPPLESAKILDEIGQILALADEGELTAFIEGCRLEVDSMAVLELAYEALARHSPPRAAALWLEKWIPGTDVGLRPLIREWEARSPREVEAWIAALEDEPLRSGALQRLLLLRAETDPEGTLSRLAEVNPREAYEVAAALGKSLDLAKMARTAEDLLAKPSDAGSEEAHRLAGLLSAWGAREPEAMWKWLLAQDTDAIGPNALTGALSGLAKEDPEGFFGRITSELGAHPSLRKVAGEAWWEWLAKDGGETAAIRWLGEHGELASGFEESFLGELYTGGYHRLHGYDWHPQRTERILAALAEVPDTPFKASFSQGFLEILSHSQAKAVLDYAMEHLPLGERTDSILAMVVGRWASSGEAEAVVRWCLEHFEAEGIRIRALQAGIEAWTNEAPRSATAFAMDLPEKEREAALRRIASYWPDQNPEDLLSFLHAAPDAEAVTPLTWNSFRSFGRSKGNARYLTKALDLPDGTMRHDAVRGLFEGWAAANPEEGAEAIRKVPAGPLRDSAILGLIPRTTSRNPELAFGLATRISVAATRDKELVARGRDWMKNNRNATERAIRADPSISDAVKAEIFKSFH